VRSHCEVGGSVKASGNASSWYLIYPRGMGDIGRMLVFVGGLLLVFGLVLILAGKINLPIGRLPGDIVYRGKNTTFYFPLMTSILLSVILSLVLYVVNRMHR
jgi:hypothetical protein